MKGLADVQVTLYDIFGYLLVGIVGFASLAVLAWALVFPDAALGQPRWTSVEWIAVLLTSYVVGHLIQAVADWATKRFVRLDPKAREAWDWVPGDLRREIVERLHLTAPGAHASEREQEAFAYEVYELCDIVVAQKGVAGGDREIYQYREGFYRGLTVSLAIGLAAVVVRALRSGEAVVGTHGRAVTGWEYLLVAVVLALAVVLSYHRYLRFFAYKWHNTFGAFALITGLIELPAS